MIASALVGLVGWVFAAEVLLYAPDGPPAPGGTATIEVVVVEGGRPAAGVRLALSASTGEVTAREGEVAPGRHRYAFRAPAEGESATFELRVEGGGAVLKRLALAPPLAPAFSAPAEAVAAVESTRIELRFPWIPDPGGGFVPPAVRVSEGRVLEVRAEPGAVVVAVEPALERQARVLAVALLDTARPGASPVFGLVRLRARPQLTLTAEPGNTMTVRIGRRSYGPFTADKTGNANVVFEVFPGEVGYEVSVSDDLGNTQKSSGPLPGLTRPVLVGVASARPGGRAAELYLAAWTPTGQPWTSAPPICRSGAGIRADAAPVSKGVFRYSIEAPTDGGALFDPRVDCGLDDASIAFRVPLGAERAERIELRVYPDALSADFPIAQVQAALLDHRGERLAPDAVRLAAGVGDLQVAVTDGALRGEYRGAAAVERGGDVVTATWNHPTGAGGPWELSLAVAPVDGGLVGIARVFDSAGRPLPGVPVAVRLGELERRVEADPRGWVRVRFPAVPAAPAVVRAVVGPLVREVVFLPAVPATLPDPAAPDLAAEIALPIRAGRVRQVFLDVAPRPLLTGTGSTGTVTIHMLDAVNKPVRDEPVQIVASAGEIGPAIPQEDGSFQARYVPPAGVVAKTVRITATTSAGTVSTDVEIMPRPINGGVSIAAGWIDNFGSISAPTLSVAWGHRLPFLPRLLSTRIGATAYGFRSSFVDPATDETITVAATLLPIDIGLQAVERWGPRSLSAGISVVLAPYSLTGDFGDTRGASGVSVASPGLAVHGGAGYRLGGSELFIEAGFLIFAATGGAIAFEGSVGGVSVTGGYRLLY